MKHDTVVQNSTTPISIILDNERLKIKESIVIIHIALFFSQFASSRTIC